MQFKTTGLFVDFKKALDSVDHKVILAKWEAVEDRGVGLKVSLFEN